MTPDEIKAAIKNLTVQERRNVALYILDLEKEHVQNTIGPQLTEEAEAIAKVVQEAIGKLKKFVNKG